MFYLGLMNVTYASCGTLPFRGRNRVMLSLMLAVENRDLTYYNGQFPYLPETLLFEIHQQSEEFVLSTRNNNSALVFGAKTHTPAGIGRKKSCYSSPRWCEKMGKHCSKLTRKNQCVI